MPSLAEKTVQQIALDHLKDYYGRRARGRMFARMEVRTRKKYGGKRADGLIAYKHWINGVETVSIEAKSAKTLPHVRPYFDARTLIKNCLWLATVVFLASGSFMFFFKMGDGFWQFLVPVNVFVLSALGYGAVSWYSYKHRQVPVLDQLARYPANYQWLALSQDAFDRLQYHRTKKLLQLCRLRGYGLILVRSKSQVQRRIKARRRYRLWGNFLKYYSTEQTILQTLRAGDVVAKA